MAVVFVGGMVDTASMGGNSWDSCAAAGGGEHVLGNTHGGVFFDRHQGEGVGVVV